MPQKNIFNEKAMNVIINNKKIKEFFLFLNIYLFNLRI